MKFGSLFANIGGIDLGLERAGMTCAWQVEIDPYATRVLQKNWPTVRRWPDVRTFPPACVHVKEGGACWRGCEKEFRVDLIAGGFPCQDVSCIGQRAGIDGTQSGLWKEYLRIIRTLRPRFVFVENVAALRSNGLDRVLGDLAASGFDAEWDCVPARAVGANHERDRIWMGFPIGWTELSDSDCQPCRTSRN